MFMLGYKRIYSLATLMTFRSNQIYTQQTSIYGNTGDALLTVLENNKAMWKLT